MSVSSLGKDANNHEKDKFNLVGYITLLQRIDERVHICEFSHHLFGHLFSQQAHLRSPKAWNMLRKVDVPLESENILSQAHGALRKWVNATLFSTQGGLSISEYDIGEVHTNRPIYKLTRDTFAAQSSAVLESRRMADRGIARLNQFVDEESEQNTDPRAFFLGLRVKIEAAVDAYLCAISPIVGALCFAELLVKPQIYSALMTQASEVASHLIRLFLPLCQRTLDNILGSTQNWLAERFIHKSHVGCTTDKERRLVAKIRLLDAMFAALDLFVFPKQFFIHSAGGIKWIAPANRRPGVIATASYDGTVVIFAFQAGDGSANSVAGEFGTATEDQRGQVLGVLRGHKSIVTWCAFSPSDHHIYSTSFDGTVRKWESATGTCLRIGKTHSDSILSADLSKDGRKLCTSSMDSTVRVWNTEIMVSTHSFKGHQAGSWIKACAFMNGGKRVVSAGLDRRIVMWGLGLDTAKSAEPKNAKESAQALASNHVNKASTSQALRIVDNAHTDFILAVAVHMRPIKNEERRKNSKMNRSVSPNASSNRFLTETEDLVATISKSGDVTLWNFDATEGLSCVVMNIPIPNGQSGWPCCVAFSRDIEGSLMVIGCINNVLLVYTTSGFKLQRQIRVHNSGILSVLFTRDNEYILVGTVDGTVERLPVNIPKT